MKRIVSLLMVFLVVFSFTTAFANSGRTTVPQEQLRYAHTLIASGNLSISNKKANCSGRITAFDSSASVSITITLQKKSGTSWLYVDSWSASGTSGALGLSASGTKSIPNGTYRVKTSGTVSVNGSSESVTAYSAEKTY